MKHHQHHQHYTPEPIERMGLFWDCLTICAIAGALTVCALAYFDILTY
jgi:hypothetical protein